jgi:hypothetical protein
MYEEGKATFIFEITIITDKRGINIIEIIEVNLNWLLTIFRLFILTFVITVKNHSGDITSQTSENILSYFNTLCNIVDCESYILKLYKV